MGGEGRLLLVEMLLKVLLYFRFLEAVGAIASLVSSGRLRWHKRAGNQK